MGDLAVDEHNPYLIRGVKPAEVNRESQRYTVAECIRLGHQMGNQILSQQMTIDRLRGNLEELRREQWIPPPIDPQHFF